jgi:chromosome segregation ATPase
LVEAKVSLREAKQQLEFVSTQASEQSEQLAAELVEKDEEVAELRSQLASLEDDFSRRLSVEVTSAAAVKTELSQTHDVLTQERNISKELRERVKELQETTVFASALQSELLQAQQELTREKAVSAGLLGELAGLQALAGDSEREKDDLYAEITALNKKLDDIQGDLSEELLVSRALREERDELLNRSQVVAVVEEEKSELTRRLLDERELVHRTSKDLKEAKVALTIAHDRIRELEGLLDAQRSSYADLTDDYESLRDRARELSDQLAELEDSLVEERRLREHSEEQFDDFKRALESNDEYYLKIQRQLESEIDQGKSRIIELEEDCTVLRGEVRDLNHKAKTLEVELNRLAEEHREDLESSREINDAMIEATIDQNDRELNKLRDLLEKKCGETTALNVRIFKLDTVMQSLKVERSMLVEKVAELDKTCEVKSAELSRLRSLVDDIKTRIATINGEDESFDDEFAVPDDF